MPASSLCRLTSVLALTAISGTASADFLVPTIGSVGWDRGVSPLSAYAEWDRFTSASGPNAPDVGTYVGGSFAASAPSWNVFDREPNSFVTGGGNIYSIGAIVAPEVQVPSFGLGAGYVTTVFLQVRTQGTELDPQSVLLGGVASIQATELYRQTLGGFGGAIVDTLFRFELSGSVSGYTIQFQSLSSSMSLDRVAVDTFTTVPAPGVACMALVGLGLANRRRRVTAGPRGQGACRP